MRWQMREGDGTRGTAQDGGGGEGGVGRKRKKAMYSAFVLIIPSRLGDIQAASVPRLGFGREGYQWVRWGASATFHRIARSQKAGGGSGGMGVGERRVQPSPNVWQVWSASLAQ